MYSIADRILQDIRENSVARRLVTPPSLHPEPDPSKRRTLVVAGNHRQYHHLLREVQREAPCDRRQFIYVQGERDMLGYSPKTLVVFYGTWYERRDAEIIRAGVRHRGYSVLQ